MNSFDGTLEPNWTAADERAYQGTLTPGPSPRGRGEQGSADSGDGSLEGEGPFYRRLGVSHLDQYFGVWAIKEDVFRAAVDRVSRLDLVGHVREGMVRFAQDDVPALPALLGSYVNAAVVAAVGEDSRPERRNGYWVKDGVAVIELVGPMMKYDSSLSDGTSTIRVRQAVRAAGRDEKVQGIVLVVDSPGGTVAGTRDLAEEIGRAAGLKPVVAYGEDMVASAAYWAASQATRFYVNASCLVGSIGTFAVLEDFTGRAAQLGIKVHVVRAGEFKGAGTPGTEVTGKILDDVQRIVSTLNEQFLSAVSSGRRLPLERVRGLADGRVHVGAAAVELGLADGVKGFDEVMAEAGARPSLKQLRRAPSAAASDLANEEDLTMGEKSGDGGAVLMTAEDTAASFSELKVGLPGADAGFICEQLERKATLAEAQTAWMARQNEKIAAAEAAAAEAAKAAEAAQASGKRVGVKALSDSAKGVAGAEDEGDAVSLFDGKVRALTAGGVERLKAVASVARKHPELHKAYLLATNPGKQAQRLIEEKYD